MPDRGLRPVVIGVGKEYRRDDGFGPFVVAELERLRPGDDVLREVDLRGCDGEPTRLIDLWSGADLAVVVDVARADAARAGEWFELVLPGAGRLPGEMAVSSHGIGLGSTVELGRALGRLPRRPVVLAAIGRDFGFGVGPQSAPNPAASAACRVTGDSHSRLSATVEERACSLPGDDIVALPRVHQHPGRHRPGRGRGRGRVAVACAAREGPRRPGFVRSLGEPLRSRHPHRRSHRDGATGDQAG